MSMILPSRAIRRQEISAPRQVSESAETTPADQAVSPSMVVFACIWAALIAYFAIHAALS
jgi:hypothetical protein